MKYAEQIKALAEFDGFERLLGDPWKSLKTVAWFPRGWTIQQFISLGVPNRHAKLR